MDQNSTSVKYYKLKEEVVNEHQDHWFTYPKGLIVEYVYTDDEGVAHFDIPIDGMSYVFHMNNLEPVEVEDFEKGIHVKIERLT